MSYKGSWRYHYYCEKCCYKFIRVTAADIHFWLTTRPEWGVFMCKCGGRLQFDSMYAGKIVLCA